MPPLPENADIPSLLYVKTQQDFIDAMEASGTESTDASGSSDEEDAAGENPAGDTLPEAAPQEETLSEAVPGESIQEEAVPEESTLQEADQQ